MIGTDDGMARGEREWNVLIATRNKGEGANPGSGETFLFPCNTVAHVSWRRRGFEPTLPPPPPPQHSAPLSPYPGRYVTPRKAS